MRYVVNKKDIAGLCDDLVRVMFVDGRDTGYIFFDISDSKIRFTGFTYSYNKTSQVLMSVVNLNTISSRMRFTSNRDEVIAESIVKEANLLHKLLGDDILFEVEN